MTASARRLSALGAMTGLFASSALATALSLHLALDHHALGHGTHATAFQAILHGQAHDEGTPDHDHVVTGAPTSVPTLRGLVMASIPVAVLSDELALAAARTVAGARIGVQPRARPPSKLAPVLRI